MKIYIDFKQKQSKTQPYGTMGMDNLLFDFFTFKNSEIYFHKT